MKLNLYIFTRIDTKKIKHYLTDYLQFYKRKTREKLYRLQKHKISLQAIIIIYYFAYNKCVIFSLF